MKYYFLIISIVVGLVSCNNYLDIDPIGKVTPKSVEDYRKLITTAYSIPKNDKVLATYRTDELVIESNTVGVSQYEDIYTWQDSNPSPSTLEFSYSNFYNIIFYTNEIINHKERITGDKGEINQLVGEAYALRALQYFDLVTLYAKPYNPTTFNTEKGVPLVTEYNPEQIYPIDPLKVIFDQIISDIEKAENLMNIEAQPKGMNYRFSLIAVKALKSRVYLYLQNWEEAIKAANQALAIKSILLDLNNGTSKMPSEYDSVESILALDNVCSFDIATHAYISQYLIDLYDSNTDLRFGNYFDYQNGKMRTKKNASTKYNCTFRTADLYLTIAESAINLNNLALSKEKLLILASRRYTPSGYTIFKNSLNNLNSTELLKVVYNERAREFAIEGKRWFDLRRTTQPEIIRNYGGVVYTLTRNDIRYTLPFPKEARINNPLLK